MAPRSARRVYGTLTAVLNHAVLHDLIARSPCRGIKLPAVEPVERPVLAPDQLMGLAEALGPEYEAMAYLGAVLGLRWGECAGLRVGRIDFRRSSILIAEQVTRGVGGRSVPGPPKSAAGRRTLAVPASLMQVLTEQLERRGLTKHDVEAFVFTTQTASTSTTPTGSIGSGTRPENGPPSNGSNSTTSAEPTPPDSYTKESTSKPPKPDSATPTPASPWPSMPKPPPRPTGQPPTPSAKDSYTANGETPAAGSPDARDGRAMESTSNPEGRSRERA